MSCVGRRVLELARESDCSVYDCEFVALAMQLGTKLVTMDRELLKAFAEHAVFLVSRRQTGAGCAH